MDDQVQNQPQSTLEKNIDSNLSKPVTQPISTGSKEAEAPFQKVSAYSTETEHRIDDEAKEIGVKEISEAPKLTPEHEKIGVKPSLEQNKIPEETKLDLDLPMTEVQANVSAKGPTTSSKTWLGILVEKIFRRSKGI